MGKVEARIRGYAAVEREDRVSTFLITVRTKDGDDSVRTLRAALKMLLRRFGLRAVRIEEEKLVDSVSSKKAAKPNRRGG
jgi:hypothetical protein